jgi:hypothetical protein
MANVQGLAENGLQPFHGISKVSQFPVIFFMPFFSQPTPLYAQQPSGQAGSGSRMLMGVAFWEICLTRTCWGVVLRVGAVHHRHPNCAI